MGADPQLPADQSLQSLTENQRVFGRFTLQHVLGRGGMGVVWKARDELLEKDVALKFVLESQALDPDSIAVLKRETRRCQELRHASIVAIYDLHQENGRAAVSMEYVEGSTLSELKNARENGCFDPVELMPWLAQLASALTYAHEEARVVHRDLKPSNLILTPAGRLKVMDFGIAQQLAGTVATNSNSWSGGVSPPYGSPQQIMGERASVADDVYSLSATIYDLLTGRPPFFRGRIDLQVLETVPPPMEQRRHELEHYGAAIPHRWEEIVARCLSKSPDQRPTSIAEMVRELEDGLTQETTTLPLIRIDRPKHEVVTIPASAPPDPVIAAQKPKPAAPVPERTTISPRAWTMPIPRRPTQAESPNWIVGVISAVAAGALAAGALHFFRAAAARPGATPAKISAPLVTATPQPAPPALRRNPLDAPPRRH